MTRCDLALTWALTFLSNTQSNDYVAHYQIVAKTAYSTVYTIVTAKQNFYLKLVPEVLYTEAAILHFLNEMGIKNCPRIVAQNDGMHCFLMASCGGQSLRQIFMEKIDFNQLESGIANYTKIQRQLENAISDLFALNIPDWRLHHFPELYERLLQQEKLLLADGLSHHEISHLHTLSNRCEQYCNELLQYKIADTINHCDFHDNNILLDRVSAEINIIDWGEVVVGHPFLSLNGCLWNLTYFHEIDQNDESYHQLQSSCVAQWLDSYDEKTLIHILNTANKLSGICAALSYERMYKATENESETVQQTHPGSIAGCLSTFIRVAEEN